MLSLDLLYAEDEEETWAVLFCMTEKGSWNVYVTEESLSKDTDTSDGKQKIIGVIGLSQGT